jgi:hypothetical protein
MGRRQIPKCTVRSIPTQCQDWKQKINNVYSDPLPILRPDLETFGYSVFAYMFGFVKFQIATELWCLVVWSAQGLDYHIQN